MHLAVRSACGKASNDAEALAEAAEQWSQGLKKLEDQDLGMEEREVLREVGELIRQATPEDPYERLFVAVVDHAAAVYRDSWPGCVLDVAKLIEAPREGRDPYGVAAGTRSSPTPMIELMLWDDGLGPATWAAVPAVLVHEAVCHVAARQGGKIDNTSPFAEGFMHWAACWFFFNWVDSLDEALAQAAREHAGPLWSALTPPASSAGAARRRGARAAGRLAGWLVGGRGLARVEAEMQVARLAVALNQEEQSLALKDHFVARINSGPDRDLEQCLGGVFMGSRPPGDLFIVQMHQNRA